MERVDKSTITIKDFNTFQKSIYQMAKKLDKYRTFPQQN